ncbi:MAG: hypothetical protein ACHQQS_05935 [Thermoanaerobaculales bacterium]
MSRLRRWFAGSRMVGEFSFLFDGALIWALTGAVVALASPAPALLAGLSPPARVFFQAGIGFGFGWWCGLPWSFAFALSARAYTPAPPVATLRRITWFAVTGFAAVALTARLTGLAMVACIGLGVVVATLAARVGLARAAHRQRG